MPFKAYLQELQKNLRGRHTERTFYPALERLLEALNPNIDAVTEGGHITEVGNPDFEVRRKGSGPDDFPIGWIEAKEPRENLDKWEKDEQLQRYRTQHNLLLTNFIEFRWYRDGKCILTARLGAQHPATR